MARKMQEAGVEKVEQALGTLGKMQEADVEKVEQAPGDPGNVGALWKSGEANKKWISIQKNVKSFQAQLKPTAASMRKLANAIVKQLDPFLEKGHIILNTVALLNDTSLVMGKLDLIGCIAKDQLEELFTIDDIDLLTITDREHLDLAMILAAAAAKNTVEKFSLWMNALQALAHGFEGKEWKAMSSKLSDDENEVVIDVIEALESVVSYLKDNKVFEAIEKHAIAVEKKVNGLKALKGPLEFPLSKSKLKEIQDEVNKTLIEGQIELGTTTISFGGLKDHLIEIVSERMSKKMDTAMDLMNDKPEELNTAKSKLGAPMDNTIGDELKDFQCCTRRIRTRIMDLRLKLAMASDAMKKAADVMESGMHNGLDEVLTSIGYYVTESSMKSKILSNMGAISSSKNPFDKKPTTKQWAEEEVKDKDEPRLDPEAIKKRLEECKGDLEKHTEDVLDPFKKVPPPPPSPSRSTSPLSPPSPSPFNVNLTPTLALPSGSTTDSARTPHRCRSQIP